MERKLTDDELIADIAVMKLRLDTLLETARQRCPKLLKDQRAEKGLREFARELKLSPSYLLLLERGDAKFTAELARRLNQLHSGKRNESERKIG